MYVCVCVCIYIYIYRKRRAEEIIRMRKMYTCTQLYIYILPVKSICVLSKTFTSYPTSVLFNETI